MNIRSLFPVPVLALICPLLWAEVAPPVSSVVTETPEQHAQRMGWWREARFGMFIHWGIYSVPAGTWRGKEIPGIGEWIMQKAKIPVADYAALAADFNPVKFDAEAWVRTAKAAGMKYIIITSKHHDGFAMFNSEASNYDIMDATPFGRDPLKELAAACAHEGIRLGFYYSQAQDWHHPGGAKRGGAWDPAQEGDMDEYLHDVAYPQVKELLTNYGPVSVLWWDTPENMTPERAALLAPLLALQPGIITNNRLGGGFMGDTETPENRVPATGYPRDWEACMTMNDTWGFKTYDNNWKSSGELIHTLVDIASKGGNYLLNVGPTSLGEIPAPSIERLQAVGRWMEKNSEAIYGTTASPFLRLDWGRATRKGDKLYLHVFKWPGDGVLTVPMRGEPKRAYLLSAPDRLLSFAGTNDGLRVEVAVTAPDPVASVLVLEGVTTVDPLPPPPIAPGPKGVLVLECDEGDLAGPGLRVEGNVHLNITGWRSTAASISWHVKPELTGDYEVALVAKIPAANAGSEFLLIAGDKQLTGLTQPSGTEEFTEQRFGTIHLDAQTVTLTLRAKRIGGEDFMKLRTLILRPMPR